MKQAPVHLLWILTAALLASCSPTAEETGSVRFAVSLQQALSSNVTRVSVTSGGPDIRSVTVDLAPTHGVWGGIIGNIPAGANRAFFARAFDASGTPLFQGSASGITISENQTTLVALNLQQIDPPPPFENEAPRVYSLASTTTVSAGGTLTLQAGGYDPNPGDTLSYAWSATAGTFSSPSTPETSWTAPLSTGIQTLTLTVTDSRGLSSSALVAINVIQGGGEGEAKLSICFNGAPEVAMLGATPSPLVVGQSTAVSVAASDPDGDSLSYSWSASCEGTWTHPTSSTARFTPTLLPVSYCNNCRLTVSVSDGRGGHNTGTVAVCVTSTPPINHLNPVLLRSYRSSDTATPGQVLTHEVAALDPEGSALTFSWDTSIGWLGTATDSALDSRVTWTAPACARDGTPPTLTATVTNAFELTTTRSFEVTGLPACPILGRWDLAGPMMGGPRWGHATVRMPGGTVVVAGGSAQKRSFYLSSVEVYDPPSDTWSFTGSMVIARSFPSLTLLSDGKLLVAGGDSFFSHFTATAELYDPATGTWSLTGSMSVGRAGHTATLLPDGKVLVTGGEDISVARTTAELYDPATGTWSLTGSMAEARPEHMATLLPGGKVLVATGMTAELYDPASGTWSLTGAPLEPVGYTATRLLDGMVLFAQGRTAQLYDPASGTWSLTGAPPESIDGPAVLLLDGRVLYTWGTTAELYDPAAGIWRVAPSMPVFLAGYTATRLLDGRVLVAGNPPNTEIDTELAELYTP